MRITLSVYKNSYGIRAKPSQSIKTNSHGLLFTHQSSFRTRAFSTNSSPMFQFDFIKIRQYELFALAISAGAIDPKHQYGASLDRRQRTTKLHNKGGWHKSSQSRLSNLEKERRPPHCIHIKKH